MYEHQLRFLLAVPPENQVKFDRFSDSAGAYITLDSNNPGVYKQLYRAAKAKLKLRLRATVERPLKLDEDEKKMADENKSAGNTVVRDMSEASQAEPRHSFLDTVLSQPQSAVPPFKSFQKTCPYSPTCSIPGAFDLNTSGMESMRPARFCQTDLFSLPTLPSFTDFPSTAYTIDCNHCGMSVPDEHYHCGICENGDFDLCKACVDNGFTCDGDEHWLLKRTIRNGVVIPSETTTLPPRKAPKNETNVTEEPTTPISPEDDESDRTCNSCICREYIQCLTVMDLG